MQDINKIIKENDNDYQHLLCIIQIIYNIIGSEFGISYEEFSNMLFEDNITITEALAFLADVSSELKGGGSSGINIEDIYAKEQFSVSCVNTSTTEKLELIVNKAFSSDLGGNLGMVNYIDFRPRLNSSSYNAREISIGTVTTRQGSYGSDIRLEGVIPVMFWGGNTKKSSGLLWFNHNEISLIHNGQITETDLETENQYIIIGGGNLGVVNY